MPPRLSFFHKKIFKQNRIETVVTGAYELNYQTGQVRLAGVIFRRTEPGENWHRRVQAEYARQRCHQSPFILDFGQPINHKLHYYNFRRLERVLREFFTDNGVVEPNPNNPTTHDLSQLRDKVFNPELTAAEKDSYQRHLDNLHRQGALIYPVKYHSVPALKFPKDANFFIAVLFIFALYLTVNQIAWSNQVDNLTNQVNRLIEYQEYQQHFC